MDVNVKNEFLFRRIHNVLATIHGHQEKGLDIMYYTLLVLATCAYFGYLSS